MLPAMDFSSLFVCGVLPGILSVCFFFYKAERNPKHKPESKKTILVRRLAATSAGIAGILGIIRYSSHLSHRLYWYVGINWYFFLGMALGMVISVGIYHGWDPKKKAPNHVSGETSSE